MFAFPQLETSTTQQRKRHINSEGTLEWWESMEYVMVITKQIILMLGIYNGTARYVGEQYRTSTSPMLSLRSWRKDSVCA